MEIKAECERKAGAWRVRVPALDNLLISTKRLDLATEQIKDLVHEYQGVDRCEVVVKVEAAMPGIMQEEASREIRDVVSRLRDEGLSMRDIGVLLQISPQRVAQLTDAN